jgi:hypothetical protein
MDAMTKESVGDTAQEAMIPVEECSLRGARALA